jgi:hypothetical protein
MRSSSVPTDGGGGSSKLWCSRLTALIMEQNTPHSAVLIRMASGDQPVRLSHELAAALSVVARPVKEVTRGA